MMSIAERTVLGKRAIDCLGWVWSAGMLTLCGVRVVEGDADYLIGFRRTGDGAGWVDTGDAIGFLPDFADIATVGCLQDLVRVQWAKKTFLSGIQPVVGVVEWDGRWQFGYRYGEVQVSCYWADTEVEALLWALENGP